jgi:hypothetical protein
MMTESARDEVARRTKAAAGGASHQNYSDHRGSSVASVSSAISMAQPTPESSPDAHRHEESELATKKPSAVAVTDFSPDDVPKDYIKYDSFYFISSYFILYHICLHNS